MSQRFGAQSMVAPLKRVLVKAPAETENEAQAWREFRSYRTNDEGIRQLRRALDGIADVIAMPLPHWRGQTDILHLLSLLSPVSETLAVAYLPLMPIPLVELLHTRGFELLPVPEQEFKTQASNILAVAPKRVIMLKGNPLTASSLRARGVEVWEYDGEEMSFNRDGGPTCLT